MTNNSAERSLAEIRSFLTGADCLEFRHLANWKKWLDGKSIVPPQLSEMPADRQGIIRQYILKITGLSRAHANRLIGEYLHKCQIRKMNRQTGAKRNCFGRIYKEADIKLLAVRTMRMAGYPARRCWKYFGENVKCSEKRICQPNEYFHFTSVSPADGWRLQTDALTFEKTNPTKVPIGERRRPEPNGKPGYLCVDSVHQGDRDGSKGIIT